MQLSHLSVPLRVCSLRLHWPALQPRLVPRSARAAVRRRTRASKSCRDAGLGFREVHVDSEAPGRAGDGMAGAGGAAGPAAPDVRHQPPGDTECCEGNQLTNTL
jgi:hypothetical protein